MTTDRRNFLQAMGAAALPMAALTPRGGNQLLAVADPTVVDPYGECGELNNITTHVNGGTHFSRLRLQNGIEFPQRWHGYVAVNPFTPECEVFQARSVASNNHLRLNRHPQIAHPAGTKVVLVGPVLHSSLFGLSPNAGGNLNRRALQALFDQAKQSTGRGIILPGHYRLRGQIHVKDFASVEVMGIGNWVSVPDETSGGEIANPSVLFEWLGYRNGDEGDAVFLFEGVRECHFGGFRLFTSGERIGYGVRIWRGKKPSYNSTRTLFSDIIIQYDHPAANGANDIIDVGFSIDNGQPASGDDPDPDTNNDFHRFWRCGIRNARIGFMLHGTQAYNTMLDECTVRGRFSYDDSGTDLNIHGATEAGLYCWGGSFHWRGGNMTGNATDFRYHVLVGTSSIVGLQSEHSGRFIQAGGIVESELGQVDIVQPRAHPVPVRVSNVRWAKPIDPVRHIAITGPIVDVQNAGPVVIESCTFEDIGFNVPVLFNVSIPDNWFAGNGITPYASLAVRDTFIRSITDNNDKWVVHDDGLFSYHNARLEVVNCFALSIKTDTGDAVWTYHPIRNRLIDPATPCLFDTVGDCAIVKAWVDDTSAGQATVRLAIEDSFQFPEAWTGFIALAPYTPQCEVFRAEVEFGRFNDPNDASEPEVYYLRLNRPMQQPHQTGCIVEVVDATLTSNLFGLSTKESGVNNRVALQALFDQAKQSSGRGLIMPGTYQLQGQIYVKDFAGVQIQGAGSWVNFDTAHTNGTEANPTVLFEWLGNEANDLGEAVFLFEGVRECTFGGWRVLTHGTAIGYGVRVWNSATPGYNSVGSTFSDIYIQYDHDAAAGPNDVVNVGFSVDNAGNNSGVTNSNNAFHHFVRCAVRNPRIGFMIHGTQAVSTILEDCSVRGRSSATGGSNFANFGETEAGVYCWGGSFQWKGGNMVGNVVDFRYHVLTGVSSIEGLQSTHSGAFLEAGGMVENTWGVVDLVQPRSHPVPLRVSSVRWSKPANDPAAPHIAMTNPVVRIYNAGPVTIENSTFEETGHTETLKFNISIDDGWFFGQGQTPYASLAVRDTFFRTITQNDADWVVNYDQIFETENTRLEVTNCFALSIINGAWTYHPIPSRVIDPAKTFRVFIPAAQWAYNNGICELTTSGANTALLQSQVVWQMKPGDTPNDSTLWQSVVTSLYLPTILTHFRPSQATFRVHYHINGSADTNAKEVNIGVLGRWLDGSIIFDNNLGLDLTTGANYPTTGLQNLQRVEQDVWNGLGQNLLVLPLDDSSHHKVLQLYVRRIANSTSDTYEGDVFIEGLEVIFS